MSRNTELSAILNKLLEPASVVTGLKVEADILENECSFISQRIAEVISLAGESDQAITSSEYIPKEFFNDMESSWKGCVKRVHAEEEFSNVDIAAEALSTAVGEEWFTTIKVESALTRYHEACDNAKIKVIELLRGLSSELQDKINILVFCSMLLVVTKALFGHVR
ncbi:hypothetical protein GUJ93_ZPchr0004g39347 [Zizania palustris]|uniref:Uncharacterized protein n=1 Tax=Zizania palustris TaxID=103762 RepID=A0A8J5SLB5_ZIZPA|nr:hypothetical protein GUJ93_ZPchr0004g39347 [Zizania palustris]